MVAHIKLTHVAVAKASVILDKVCSTANGYAVYIDGWSDSRVEAELREAVGPIPITGVADLRRKIYGPFPPKPKPEPKPETPSAPGVAEYVDMLKDLMAHHTRLAKLEEQVDFTRDMVKTVETTLARRCGQIEARADKLSELIERVNMLDASLRTVVGWLKNFDTGYAHNLPKDVRDVIDEWK